LVIAKAVIDFYVLGTNQNLKLHSNVCVELRQNKKTIQKRCFAKLKGYYIHYHFSELPDVMLRNGGQSNMI